MAQPKTGNELVYDAAVEHGWTLTAGGNGWAIYTRGGEEVRAFWSARGGITVAHDDERSFDGRDKAGQVVERLARPAAPSTGDGAITAVLAACASANSALVAASLTC